MWTSRSGLLLAGKHPTTNGIALQPKRTRTYTAAAAVAVAASSLPRRTYPCWSSLSTNPHTPNGTHSLGTNTNNNRRPYVSVSLCVRVIRGLRKWRYMLKNSLEAGTLCSMLRFMFEGTAGWLAAMLLFGNNIRSAYKVSLC